MTPAPHDYKIKTCFEGASPFIRNNTITTNTVIDGAEKIDGEDEKERRSKARKKLMRPRIRMATICELVERGNFAAYVFLCMLVGVFFIISDVAGNCMIIELGLGGIFFHLRC